MCNAKVSQAVRAHPRSRGENRAFGARQVEACGSSPLTRGKRVPPQGHGEAEGLIPAHAGKTHSRIALPRTGSAHPRSRGENYNFAHQPAALVGSSPLTRGKRRGVTQTTAETRLIPAHAGKTGDRAYPVLRQEAHPRSRGENRPVWPTCRTIKGSSPLTRGKLTPIPQVLVGGGLIPAHAGKTRRFVRNVREDSAHPRSRGENSAGTSAAVSSAGSSPLTRGKLRGDSLSSAMIGLIPAHAGKTATLVGGHDRGAGSSPLTRGKRSRRERG